jgi:hypothetical protein
MHAVVLLVFVGPKVYEMNKEQIDEGIVVAQGHINSGVDMAKSEFTKMTDKVPALKNLSANLSGKKTE